MGYGYGQDPATIPGTIEYQQREFELQQQKDKQAQEHAARMAELGYNPDGSPMAPEWEDLGTIFDEQGNLMPEYEMGYNTLDPSSIAGYSQFEDFATGTGLSPWAIAQQERLGIEEQMQREDVQRGAQSAAAQAQSQLAMRGGLRSGARERIATSGARDALRARQEVAGQAMLQRADIGSQDAANRQQALQNFVGMGADIEQFNVGQRTAADQFNIGTRLAELSERRSFELGAYEQEVEKWAAEKKAEAQRNVRGGCFAPGSQVAMADGTFKPIEKICIGDEVYGGSTVYALYATKWEAPLYDYKGVVVTGEHPVYEGGQWMRVKDSAQAKKSEEQHNVVYDFSNVNHRIIIEGVIFSDYAETDDPTLSYDQMIQKLNSKQVGDVAVC